MAISTKKVLHDTKTNKELKEIIKTLGGTYEESDNCTCELLGRVNDGLKNILGSGLKLVESVDCSEPAEKFDTSITYKLNKNEYEANKTYLIEYTSGGYVDSITTFLKLGSNGIGEGFGTIPYDDGDNGYGTIVISRDNDNGSSNVHFTLVGDFTPIDELSYINIYELCLVSGEGESEVKVIDLGTENYTEFDVDGSPIVYLDKGKYYVWCDAINEGNTVGVRFGNFSINHNGREHIVRKHVYLSQGCPVAGAISMNNEQIIYFERTDYYCYWIEVTDTDVYITSNMEI